jgi:glycosyltransferase involved in cell wall biosynthesis
VADGEDVSRLLENNDANIRYIHIENNRTIGEKRNFGSANARGKIIVNWDDDDYSAPGRIADQLQRLLGSGKSVTGYHSMLFTDGVQWWKYGGRESYSMGTALCYKKEYWSKNPFPYKQIGEDADFSEQAHRVGQLASVDAGEMMVATIHPGNTSSRMLSAAAWQQVKKPDGFKWEQCEIYR